MRPFSPILVLLCCVCLSLWAQTANPAPATQSPTSATSAAPGVSSPIIPLDENGRKAKALVEQGIQALGGDTYLNIRDREQQGRGYGFHHGRPSGYSQVMMDAINPQLVIISDVAGQSETDRRCRESPTGLQLEVAPDTEKRLCKFLSTKRGGRLRFDISTRGSYKLHQYEYEYWK